MDDLKKEFEALGDWLYSDAGQMAPTVVWSAVMARRQSILIEMGPHSELAR